MRRHTLPVLAALYSTAFLLIAGCGGGGGGGPTNPGGGGTPDPVFDLRFPATGASQSFTFTKDGAWDYACTPHAGSGMDGTVVVNAGSANDSALVTIGPSNTLTFSPASVTIKTGGTVRWVNASNMTNHTVTRP